MSQKTYFLVCSAVFFVVAAAHLTRLIVGWEIAIAGWTAPQWISIPGLHHSRCSVGLGVRTGIATRADRMRLPVAGGEPHNAVSPNNAFFFRGFW